MRSKQKSLKYLYQGRFIYIVIFITGCIVFSYPLISSYINTRNQSKVLSNYQVEMKKMDEEQKRKIKEEAALYNEYVKRLEGNISDDLTDSQRNQATVQYMDALNIGEVMGYVEIPKLDIRLPIYHGTDESVLQRGIGHMERTSLPIGGEGTHSVLTGHRGLPSGRMFRDLNKLVEGDIFLVNTLDEVLAYKIENVMIIEPTNTAPLVIKENEDLVTLLTCEPYMINSHRLIVTGHRTEYSDEVAYEALKNQITFFEKYIEYFIIIFIFVLLLLIACLSKKYIIKRKNIHET